MNIEYKLIGYLAEWEPWSVDKIDAGKMTHLNYAFAKITDGVVSGANSDRLLEFRKIKLKSPKLKTIISIGGWEAEGFSDAALTEESRGKFVTSAIEFMKNNGFDGIDLDWEYPCSSEAGIKSRPEDKRHFTLLLQKLREGLDETGTLDGKHYLLTIATGATDEYVVHTELETISGWVDFINVMTYDFHNGVAATAGHHTNLYASAYDDGDRMSAETAVRGHINSGVPASKIVLGCAFYGRSWSVPSNLDHGLYKPVEGTGSVYPYNALVSGYINKNGFQRFWDDSAKAPYLWNGSRFISYDDPESLGCKTAYIKLNGLGGAMFWEYNQDQNQTLLNKLYTDLK